MLMSSNVHCAWDPREFPRLSRRLQELAGQICAHPQQEAVRNLFTEARPVGFWVESLRALERQNGRIAWLEPLHVSAENAGTALALTVRKRRVKISLTLELEGRGRIVELSCPSDALHEGFASLHGDFASLPGQAGLCCWELTPQGPREVVSYQPDRPLSVASVYKLYLLGALAHTSSWGETLRLCDSVRSVPTGVLHHWPTGCRLSVQSLAALMISMSDNTAAELVLQHLGKERAEEAVVRMGHSHPARLRPLLSSLDTLRLKSAPEGGRCEMFLERDEQGRRALLLELAQLPRESLAIPSTPLHPEVGWWASASDICRALAWLSRSPEAVEILQINPGLAIHRNRWPGVGFKGGGEPGAVAAGWLLQHADQRQYVLGAAWNQPLGGVSEARFFALLESLLGLLPDGRLGPDVHSLYPRQQEPKAPS
jgi:hypothetical protein